MSRNPTKRARASARAAYNNERMAGVDSSALSAAMSRVLAEREAELVTPSGRRSRSLTARTFPVGDAGRWVPIGPSVARRGQAMDRPAVTGRIRDLAVDEDGVRAYAATAKGGVWYTADAGRSWSPVGGWAAHPRTVGGDNNALATGCLLVEFGVIDLLDVVLVGTGETTPAMQTSGNLTAGVGVLAGIGPSDVSISDNPWEPDTGAALLAGLGIYRIVRRPGTDPGTIGAATDVVVACTSSGAYLGTRSNLPPAPPLAARVGYSWVAMPAFPTGLVITDALWLDIGGGRHRLVVAIAGQGLRWSDDLGVTSMNVPSLHRPGAAVVGRMSLAHATGNRFYALGETDRARVWQIADASVVPVVATNVPGLVGTADLWGTGNGSQRDYDQAVAVDADPAGDRLYVGGAVIDPRPGADWSASLWAYDVSPAPALTIPRALAGRGAPPANAGADRNGLIGNNMHGDVHSIRVTGPARPGRHVWVGNDGGVYVSQADGRVNTFAARNNGLAALEANVVASHPTSAHYLALGCQDNGVQMRRGDTVWELTHLGDGGGVAFHPVASDIVVAQFHNATWQSTSRRAFVDPMLRSPGEPWTAIGREDTASQFYSEAATFDDTGPGGTGLLAIGTNRVWLTRDLGTNRPPAWVALPHEHVDGSGNPRAEAENDSRPGGVDRQSRRPFGVPLNSQPVANQLGGVESIDFAAAGEVITAYQSGVVRYVEGPATEWTTTVWSVAAGTFPGAAGRHITDLAAIPGTQDFYVSTSGDPATPGTDTLFLYTDADATFHPTGLRQSLDPPPGANPLDPAYTVVVDPAAPDTVYVGTVTGVWMGTLTRPLAGPHVAWVPFINGLPEATVQDLDIWVDPAATPSSPRLMRAAVQSRGVWEVDLAAPARRETYLRVHAFDSRRILPTPLLDPRAAPGAVLPVHASPDIVVRPAWPRATPPPWQWGAPLSRANAPAYPIWTFQTAFRHLYPFVEATGVVTEAMQDVLRFHRQLTGRSITATIDRGLWEDVVGRLDGVDVVGGVRLDPSTLEATVDPAHPLAVHCPPWRSSLNPDASATELDLVERIRTPRLDGDIPAVPREPSTVEVLLHHRDLREVPRMEASVIVYWRSGGAVADLMAAPVDDIVAHADAHVAGLSHAAPAGWSVAVDVFGMSTWTNDDPVSARMPRSVPVDVDVSTVPPADDHVVFLAVAASSVDGPRLPAPAAATVATLVLRWPYAAARVVRLL